MDFVSFFENTKKNTKIRMLSSGFSGKLPKTVNGNALFFVFVL